MGSALVVVGGGPAALSTARAYRAAGGTGRVQLFSADLHPPYNRPPMSKGYLRGESEAEDLPLEHEGFYAEQDIELFLDRRVAALVPDEPRIVLEGGDSVGFDLCVLATGAAPAPLPVRGGDHPDLLHLRSRTDAERLRRTAEAASTAIVVGSGFIGCEAAASLAARGLRGPCSPPRRGLR